MSSIEELKAKNAATRQANLICPIMSIGQVKPPSALVTAGPKPQDSLVACQREKCALWVTLYNEKNAPVGGGCSFSISAQGLIGLQPILGMGVQIAAQATGLAEAPPTEATK